MDSATLKNKRIFTFKGLGWLLHLIYWSAIVAIFYLKFHSFVLAGKYPVNYLLITFAVRLSCLFFLCYSFLLYLIPRYTKYKGLSFWGIFLAILAFWDLLSLALVTYTGSFFPSVGNKPGMQFWSIFKEQSFTFIILFAFFIAFYYFRDIFVRQREIQLLAKFKTEKIALESSFLKSQVNPHFLFNTLNNIYALSLKKSAQTPVIIERLESLLHYMLYECKADFVKLSDEFTFTNSYIALEKLRHRDDQCVVTVNIEGEVNIQRIAPLLLINFLENAFKHGTKTSFGKSWINMDVTVVHNSMHFVLQNSKPLQIMVRQQNAEYTGGIGLKNVKRRLEILYPGKHKLQITDLKDRFEVDLTVNF